METLVACLRRKVAEMPEVACLGEHGGRAHLTWMIDTAERERTLPLDKRLRWLGFVAGSRDFALFGSDGISGARMRDIDCPVLSATDPKNERVLFAGVDEVLEGLEEIAEDQGGHAVTVLLEEARRSATAGKASFCLGYAQAWMTHLGLIEVNAERDRTRPIFHRVYVQCGYAVPGSLSRT